MQDEYSGLKRIMYRTLVMTDAFKLLGFKTQEKKNAIYLTFSDPDAHINEIMLDSGDAEMAYFEVEVILGNLMLPWALFDGLYNTCEANQNRG